MFRGHPVDCHGGPERLDFVLAERQRRPLGTADVLAIDDTTLGTPLHRVHSARNLDFLQGAWDKQVEIDPSNARRDAMHSILLLSKRYSFRIDVLPENFATQRGAFCVLFRLPAHRRQLGGGARWRGLCIGRRAGGGSRRAQRVCAHPPTRLPRRARLFRRLLLAEQRRCGSPGAA